MLKCVLQYFDPFYPSGSFMSLYISNTIGYTSLHSDSTVIPLTYHIRVPSLDLYVHLITLYISVHCFVPHTHILHPSCNIDTDDHLLFIKPPSSKLHKCLGKVISLFSLFSCIRLLYLSWINFLSWFTIYGFGTTRPCCCSFTTLSSLIPLQ